MNDMEDEKTEKIDSTKTTDTKNASDTTNELNIAAILKKYEIKGYPPLKTLLEIDYFDKTKDDKLKKYIDFSKLEYPEYSDEYHKEIIDGKEVFIIDKHNSISQHNPIKQNNQEYPQNNSNYQSDRNQINNREIYNDVNQEKRKKDKVFTGEYVTGIITGTMFSLCFALAVFVFFVITGSIDINKSGSGEIKDSTAILGKLETIKELIDEKYLGDVDEDLLVENIYQGFMEAINDKYGSYYSKDEFEALQQSISGNYTGIGVVVTQDPDTKVITVTEPYIDAPGYKAGIRSGDTILAIDGKDISDLPLEEAVLLIKGEEGTKVVIKIFSKSENKEKDIEVTREKIVMPSVSFEMLEDKIGYIYIGQFEDNTFNEVKKAIQDLKNEGVKGIVFDVRNNPGGLYTSVVDILDYILPKGLIVYTEDKNGIKEETFSDEENKLEMPMAVIINGESASASEIFSAALQDYEWATIVGTTSYGKALVQGVYPLSDGSAVKMTIASYYTPLGRDINGIGVKPDVEVELPDEVYETGMLTDELDTQLQKAIENVKSKIK